MIRHLLKSAFGNAYILLSMTAFFWASNFVVARGVNDEVPPIALACIRWTLAALLLLPFALKYIRKDWPLMRAHWPILLFLGATGVGCFNSFAYVGLTHTTAINALILQSSGPIFIALTTYLLFGDRLTLIQMVGLFFSLIGVLLIVTRGILERFLDFAFNPGDLWIFAALVVWALYTAMLRKCPKIHWLSLSLSTFTIGAAVNLPFFVWEHASGQVIEFSSRSISAIFYVGIFPSVIAYIFYNRSVELIGGNLTGIVLSIIPVFGTLLSVSFLGENLELFHLAGMGLIFFGIWLATRLS